MVTTIKGVKEYRTGTVQLCLVDECMSEQADGQKLCAKHLKAAGVRLKDDPESFIRPIPMHRLMAGKA